MERGRSIKQQGYEAQYAMAAFADEVFIHLDWEGKRTWTSNLLESTAGQLSSTSWIVSWPNAIQLRRAWTRFT
jgi:hypothetical protein